MLAKFFSVALLAVTVIADGASILSALDTITKDTVKIGETVGSWDGKLFGTLPIIVESTKLLADINNGTKVAQASANLTTLEVIGVARATFALATDVNTTLTTIIAAKPKFDKLILGPVIALNLKLEKDATAKFSNAVLSKVPEALRPVAAGLIAQIDNSFALALDAYNPFPWLE